MKEKNSTSKKQKSRINNSLQNLVKENKRDRFTHIYDKFLNDGMAVMAAKNRTTCFNEE